MKYTALALLFFALNWIPLRAQIDVKRKLEKKADQVLDEFLFGKKKNKDNAPQASYPSGGDPMETYEPSDDNDPLGGYKREPVNFGSLNRMNVVGFRELIHFLPNQFGPYELSAKPDGATMRMGEYTYSMGGKDYTNGEDENGDLQAVIYDYLQTGNLLAAYVNQYEYETTDGIMKSV
ncbi:MAG: hypothetical protein OEY56_10700, partial [Cyclobacteriaceae bacterium]|nr:hypothetical protein [Cyclobacteriaceae bacterium]